MKDPDDELVVESFQQEAETEDGVFQENREDAEEEIDKPLRPETWSGYSWGR